MNETMGQIIRRLRKEKNLTQEELAEQLNITYQAVSRWENGTGMPDISQVVPLSNVFGVTTDVLFGTQTLDRDEEIRKIIEDASALQKLHYETEKEELFRTSWVFRPLRRSTRDFVTLTREAAHPQPTF